MSIVLVPLSRLATARSGDKGSHVNIGIIARLDAYYPFIKEYLTEERVKRHFERLAPKKVVRYELENLSALNFILYNVLDGGGSLSLRTDAQGKTYGQALLLLPVEIPTSLIGAEI